MEREKGFNLEKKMISEERERDNSRIKIGAEKGEFGHARCVAEIPLKS